MTIQAFGVAPGQRHLNWHPDHRAGVSRPVRARAGTGGSGGTWTLLDHQEREDLFDLIDWIAAQP